MLLIAFAAALVEFFKDTSMTAAEKLVAFKKTYALKANDVVEWASVDSNVQSVCLTLNNEAILAEYPDFYGSDPFMNCVFVYAEHCTADTVDDVSKLAMNSLNHIFEHWMSKFDNRYGDAKFFLFAFLINFQDSYEALAMNKVVKDEFYYNVFKRFMIRKKKKYNYPVYKANDDFLPFLQKNGWRAGICI